jgi:hypothetical protein
LAEAPSAFVTGQDRVEVLKNSAQSRGSHISIGPAREIVFQALRNFLREPLDSGGLEKRQPVELIVLIIQHGVARYVRVIPKPCQDLVSPRAPSEGPA